MVFLRDMKRNEILDLLAILVPGQVWNSIDLGKISDEHARLPQPSVDIFRDTIEENTASGDMMMAA